MRLLVIQTAFLGDVILTLPLLDLARTTDGVAWLGVVATPAAAELLRTQNVADEIIEYDKRGLDRGVVGFLRVAGLLRRRRFDAALLPHRSFRSALLAFAGRVPRRVGFDESGGRALLTDVLPYRARPHEAERLAGLVEVVGGVLPPGRVPLRAAPRVEDSEAAGRALSAAGLARGVPFIVVAPGSAWPTKRWLPERFAEAAETIARRTDAAVVLAGSSGDRGPAAAVARAMRVPPVDVVGALPVGPWLALVAGARLVLSNDSAAAHAAAAVGTPVVAVFGPTVPEQGFAPYGSAARVVEVGFPCRPCGRHGAARCPLGTAACMKAVEVGAVVEAAALLMKDWARP